MNSNSEDSEIVIGIDEAGRGPLAGPVAIGAVQLDPEKDFDELKDSKKLSAKKRAELDLYIREHALYTDVRFVDHEMIDELNIKQATIFGMEEIIKSIKPTPGKVIIDGNEKLNVSVNYESIVNGDQTEKPIMAAAIIAKVARDKFMLEIDEEFPEYGFRNHKGYGTKEHLNALKINGPCKYHRRSFKPVKEAELNNLENLEFRRAARELLEKYDDKTIKSRLEALKDNAEYLNNLRKALREEWLYIKKASSKR